LYAARAGLRTVVLDRGLPGGQMLNTTDIENYPGIRSILGPELSRRMAGHAQDFGAEFVMANVTRIERQDGRFLVHSSGGLYEARAVIYSAGSTARQLGVPGEERLRGRGVSYCATCDGAFFKGLPMAVIGGGDSAATEVLHLRHLTDTVYMVHRRDRLRAKAALAERVLADERIQMVWNAVCTEILGEHEVTGVRLRNVATGEEPTLEVAVVFVAIGLIPNTDLVQEFVEVNESGFIKTTRAMETRTPGLYVVGDVTDAPLRQIVTSCGDGAIAAHCAHDFITGGPYGYGTA
jgi:thioredoxin reductase (NADPH)